MAKLLLDSLEINNFRGLRHLQIEKLGRVNLLVGKNNIGKTTLLEALHLYARKDGSHLIGEILQERYELRIPWMQASPDDITEALKYLFLGWKDVREHSNIIQIGPLHNPDECLTIAMDWATLQFASDGSRHVKSVSLEDLSAVDNIIPRLQFRQGQAWTTNYLLSSNYSPPSSGFLALFNHTLDDIPDLFISANGLDRATVASLWDKIALTDFEKEVISALRILAPGKPLEQAITARYLDAEAPYAYQLIDWISRLFNLT
ncbi:MAG TPA: AAA family ATPase [Ktedonobacteraceae bacterium]